MNSVLDVFLHRDLILKRILHDECFSIASYILDTSMIGFFAYFLMSLNHNSHLC